jgi:hypothetical protein
MDSIASGNVSASPGPDASADSTDAVAQRIIGADSRARVRIVMNEPSGLVEQGGEIGTGGRLAAGRAARFALMRSPLAPIGPSRPKSDACRAARRLLEWQEAATWDLIARRSPRARRPARRWLAPDVLPQTPRHANLFSKGTAARHPQECRGGRCKATVGRWHRSVGQTRSRHGVGRDNGMPVDLLTAAFDRTGSGRLRQQSIIIDRGRPHDVQKAPTRL